MLTPFYTNYTVARKPYPARSQVEKEKAKPSDAAAADEDAEADEDEEDDDDVVGDFAESMSIQFNI